MSSIENLMAADQYVKMDKQYDSRITSHIQFTFDTSKISRQGFTGNKIESIFDITHQGDGIITKY